MNYVKTAIPAWPRFEDGEPVRFGDEVLDMSNHGFVVHSFTFYEGSVILSSGHGYGVRTRGTAIRPTPDQMADYYAKWPMEKAISATPGGGECKIIGSTTINLMRPDRMTKWYELSCGHSLALKGSEPPRFCPKCDAKVESGGTREQLEADIRAWHRDTPFATKPSVQTLLGWLDRQAALTTAECTSEDESCCEACRAAQKRRIAELTAERNRLVDERYRYKLQCERLEARIAEMEAMEGANQ